MGSWGNENFQDDASLDTLVHLLDGLIITVQETFKKQSDYSLYDGEGDSKIIANIDILDTLYNHYRIYPQIDVNEVVGWAKHYLKSFDQVYHGDLDDTDVIQRRKVVEKTFERLITTIKVLREYFDSQVVD